MSEHMALMSMIFGTNNSFSATLILTEQGVAEEYGYTFSKGNVRMEDDQLRKPDLKPKIIEALKKEGLTRLVYILQPNKHVGYLLIPGKKVYMHTQFPPSSDPNMPRLPKMERKELGRETTDGHPCIKQRVTITSEEGDSFDFLSWEASDLGGLPIRFQDDSEVVSRSGVLKNIKLGKPDPSVFEVPRGYRKLTEEEAAGLMMGMMQLRMSGDFGTPPAPVQPTNTPKQPLSAVTTPAAMQAQFNYTTNGNAVTITKYVGAGGVVSIPDKINGLPVTTIGRAAFSFCDNSPTSITIPDSVTNIEQQAFAACVNLTNVVISSSVTTIDRAAFYSCFSLKGIYFQGNAPRLLDPTVFYDSNKVTIYYLRGKTGWTKTFGERPTAVWSGKSP